MPLRVPVPLLASTMRALPDCAIDQRYSASDTQAALDAAVVNGRRRRGLSVQAGPAYHPGRSPARNALTLGNAGGRSAASNTFASRLAAAFQLARGMHVASLTACGPEGRYFCGISISTVTSPSTPISSVSGSNSWPPGMSIVAARFQVIVERPIAGIARSELKRQIYRNGDLRPTRLRGLADAVGLDTSIPIDDHLWQAVAVRLGEYRGVDRGGRAVHQVETRALAPIRRSFSLAPFQPVHDDERPTSHPASSKVELGSNPRRVQRR